LNISLQPFSSRSTLCLALLAALGLAGCGESAAPAAAVPEDTGATRAPAPTRGPQISAHRGGPAQLPENTLPAFQAAIELGYDILEFDMNLTADDQVVLHHDVRVNPEICRQDAANPVPFTAFRQLTLAQAQSFDCGSHAPTAFPGQAQVPGARMPSLDEFLAAVKASDTVLFGETKMPKGEDVDSIDPVLFVERINAAVRRHGLEERFILQSGDYRTIDAMHQVNPAIRTCLLRMGEAKPDFVGVAKRHNAACVVMRLDYGDAADIAALKQAGILVYSDVADEPAQWETYLELGVDAILSNDTVALRDFLVSKGLRTP
jgi:glycerophosphoryl diester phosphodiesterase